MMEVHVIEHCSSSVQRMNIAYTFMYLSTNSGQMDCFPAVSHTAVVNIAINVHCIIHLSRILHLLQSN